MVSSLSINNRGSGINYHYDVFVVVDVAQPKKVVRTY